MSIGTDAATEPPAKHKLKRKKPATKKAALSPELITANLEHRTKAGLADDVPRREHENERVHGARAPPLERLLSKHDVVAITNLSFPTLWLWQRQNRFPRARICGGKSMWLYSEIAAWIAALPVRQLKGDAAEFAPDDAL